MNRFSEEEHHSSFNFINITATVYANDDSIFFELKLKAVSTEAAEEYIRSVYPNISTIYVYEDTNND